MSELERELAVFLKIKRVLTFDSGRTSLFMALQALDLDRGDEVIVPAYTCGIVFEAVLRAGLTPVLVDVNPETFNIDPALVPRSITPKTRGIIAVHLFGRACQMDEIMEIANEQDLYVIEDVAQALGSEHKGEKVGSFGDMTVLSFGSGNKSLSAGGGGAVAVKNNVLLKELSKLHHMLPESGLIGDLLVLQRILAMCMISKPDLYPLMEPIVERNMEKEDIHILTNCLRLFDGKRHLYRTMGFAKISGLAATIAKIQLSQIDQLNRKRVANAVRLTQFLEKKATTAFQLPSMPEDGSNTFTRYPVIVRKETARTMTAKLKKRGVDADRVYYRFMPILNHLDCRHIQAERLYGGLICLPNYPTLGEKDLFKISVAFRNAL